MAITPDSKRPNHDSSVICEIVEYNQAGIEVTAYVNTKNENEEGYRVDVVVSITAKRLCNKYLLLMWSFYVDASSL